MQPQTCPAKMKSEPNGPSDSDSNNANSFNNSNMETQDAVVASVPQQQLPGTVVQGPQIYTLSKKRWLVLFAMTLFGLISSATGEFSAILSVMLELLELPIDKYVYIGQLSLYLPALTTIPIAWFTDKYGLRVVMYVAMLFMSIRSMFRALMFFIDFPGWQRSKRTYWILSGFAAAQSAAMFYCMPLKVSENWFPESERSIAWTIMVSSYSIGGTIASFVLPRYIHHVSDVKPLAYLNFIGGIVLSIVIVICITRSKPKHPPSERTLKSSARNTPWLVSIKNMLSQRDIVVHILHETIFNCLNQAVDAVIQDILISSGHSKIFVGNLLAMNSFLSVVVLVSLAAVVHLIIDMTLTCKVASIIRALIFITHLLTLLYPCDEWIILVVSVIYIICKSWASPNINNMTAHLISGTVSEATVAGVSSTVGVILMSLIQIAFVKLMHKDEAGKSDYTYSMTMASIVCALNTLVYIIFFRGQKAKNIQINCRAGGVSNQNLTDSLDDQRSDRESAS